MKTKTLLLIFTLTLFSCEKRKVSTDVEGVWEATFVERKVFESGFQREHQRFEDKSLGRFVFQDNGTGTYFVDTGVVYRQPYDNPYSFNKFAYNYSRPFLYFTFSGFIGSEYYFPFLRLYDTLRMEVKIEDFENIELLSKSPTPTAQNRTEIHIKLRRLSK